MDMFSAEYLDEVQNAGDDELWEGAKSYSGLAKANVFYELSRRAYFEDDNRSAVDLSAVAIDEYLALGDLCPWTDLIDAYTIHGVNNSAMDNFTEAAESIRKSIDYMRIHRKDDLRGQLYLYGLFLGFNQSYEETIEPYLEAIELSQLEKSDSKLISALKNLGESFLKLGRLDESDGYITRAIEEAKKNKDSEELICSLEIYGKLCKDRMEFSKAIEYFSKAYNLNQTLGNETEAALNQFEMGECWFNLARFDKSVESHAKSLKMLRKFAPKDLSLIMKVEEGLIKALGVGSWRSRRRAKRMEERLDAVKKIFED